MRLVVALVGPALLAVVFMESATFVANRSAERPPPQRLEWAGRVFTSEAAFERWLAARGRSYEVWRERHPESPWSANAENGGERSPGPSWLTTAAAGLTGAAAAVVVFLLARRAADAAAPSIRRSLRRRAGALRAALASLLASLGALARRTTRELGPSARAALHRSRRALLAVRATAPVETRRVRALLRLRAYELVVQARVVRHTPEARAAVVYGAGMVVSGALGTAIAFLLH